jgi:hypothetical protein
MGIKRKASAFEEDDSFLPFYQSSRTDTPSLASSSPLSTTTNHSSASSSDAYQSYNVKPIPFLSSRTRKRYRDARPDEEAIHENTLKKLFDAQRLHLDEATIMSDTFDTVDEEQRAADGDIEMADDETATFPEVELPATAERNQQVLEAFFGAKWGAKSSPSTCGVGQTPLRVLHNHNGR